MKIKQIKLISPELYLVTYTTCWLKREIERYVIAEPQDESLVEMGHTKTYFYYRDSDERVFDCAHHLEWMIRNDVTFFDNFPTAYGKYQLGKSDLIINKPLKVEPITKEMVNPDGNLWDACEICNKPHDPQEYCNPTTEDPYPNISLTNDITKEPK